SVHHGRIRMVHRADLAAMDQSDAGPPGSRTRCFRACQGSATPPGAGTPCRSGVPAVAFRVFGARRHPDWPFRGSIPCLHVPLSTLHRPRYQSLRMTRGQRGWLDLRCQRLALFHTVPVCPGTPERWPRPFFQTMHELGWVEGQNITVERRDAERRAERLPELAADLVRLGVEVIIAHGTRATQAAMHATTTIPIV